MSAQSQISAEDLAAVEAVTEVAEEIKAVLALHLEGSRFRSYWADLAVREPEEAEAERVGVEMEAGLRRLETEAQREKALKLVLETAPRGANARESLEAELLLRTTLLRLRSAGLISLKTMCEFLVLSSDLKSLSSASVETYRFLKEQLTKLDYKGVRDILKQLLDRLTCVPPSLTQQQRELLVYIEDVVLEMVDRKNNYLPAYFVMNELYKLYQIFQPLQSNIPHHRAFTIARLAEAFAEVFESFKPLARLVSVTGRWMLTPVWGHRGLTASSAWRLDPHTFRYSVKGSLPYSPENLSPQSFLIYSLISQPRGKEMITNHVFGRERRSMGQGAYLSEYVSLCLVEGMRVMESGAQRPASPYRWLYLANLFVNSVLGPLASFPTILASLIEKLTELPYREARDELTWVVLQYVSGIGKNLPAEDGELVLKLYRLLYTGEEEFLMSGDDPFCVKKMAPTCLWIHLKTQGNEAGVPPTIQNQISFLEERFRDKRSLGEDQGSPLLAVVCNACMQGNDSSDTEKEKMVMGQVVEGVESGEAVHGALPSGPPAFPNTKPLSMSFLDSLTLHAKIVLGTHMKNILQRQKPLPSPAALESYLRMIATTAEVDAIKVIIMQIFPTMINMANLDLVYTVCEMLSYRLPPCCLPIVFKAQSAMAMRLALNNATVAAHPQLHLMLELCLLRTICWSHSSEFLHLISRVVHRENQEPFPEDIARVIVLNLARSVQASATTAEAMQVSGEQLLNRLGVKGWSPTTLALFPPSLAAHFHPLTSSHLSADRQAMERQLQDEYIMWRSLGAEQSLVEHFIRSDAPPVFLCLLFKIVKENQKVPPFAYKILEQLGPKVMGSNMQRLVDHLIRFCIANQAHQNTLNAMVETLDKLMWTWWIIPVERFVLTVVMSHNEEREAQAALWILHWLLSRSASFNARIKHLVANVSANHWLVEDTTERLKIYYANFPVKSWSLMQAELSGDNRAPYFPPLPVYFAHLGLSFLPVPFPSPFQK